MDRHSSTTADDGGTDAAAGSLAELLERNQSHTETLPAGYFDDVLGGQHPPVVSVCCSDSRVPQEGMWAVDEPGWLFSPSNIGNVVWDDADGDRVVDGNVHYPIVHTSTANVTVVGHSQCGAVTAAYTAVTENSTPEEPGIRKRVELLVPVVEAGLDSEVVDADQSDEAVIDQLIEYNVHRQVEFLLGADAVSDIDIYGFVYDFHATYGEVRGRTYLVNANGTTDPAELRRLVPAGFTEHVGTLLESSF